MTVSKTTVSETTVPKTTSGGCACGGVRYEVLGPMRDVANCHCEPCRRITGHFVAASAVGIDDLRTEPANTLRWYDSTDSVQYGFCSHCGSTLFWRAGDKPQHISIMAGTIDPPTGLVTSTALFTGSASDYHRLDDQLELVEGDWDPGRTA